MSVIRFSWSEIAARSLGAEIFGKVMSVCMGSKEEKETVRMRESSEMSWEIRLRSLQSEAEQLCDEAVNEVIPQAGIYQLNMLDMISQVYSLYSPEEAEKICLDTTACIEKISSHIAGIRYSAEKLSEANRWAKKTDDTHTKDIVYERYIAPYKNVIQFHVSELKQILN